MSYFFAWFIGFWFILFGGMLLKATIGQQLRPLLRYRKPSPGQIHPGEKIYFQGQYSVGKSIVSPLTKTPCLRWQLTVTEAKGKQSRLLLNQSSKTTFFVADQQQILAVLPRQQQSGTAIAIGKSRVVLPSPQQELDSYVGLGKCHYQVQQNIFMPLRDPQAIAFLEAHHINPKGPLGNRRGLVLREYIWVAGDPVYIYGKLIQRDRQHKLLIPWIITHQPRARIVIILGSLGLIGLGLLIAGITVILQGGLPL
ncbi:hypothetical protein AWQ21_10570 [Picosynechococcus sp. PCC 7003]|uniref:hypothetical protein n=1 Tax=Picosynechococcus sp. PCC 7003 TaxID=374981 RepID=UPI000810823C|nr:hypothetical protein [Picosynechococcus sp. PCC 7003]ANV84784.1 hypothetical protein AWQ21_10570 [Picosynechococcus sp. PCC 7003]